MKYIITIAILAISFTSTFAQAGLKIGSFKIKKFYIEQAHQEDMVDGLSYQYFTDRLPSDARASLRYASMDEGYYYGGVCENPAINAGFTLTHPRFKNVEWRNGFSYMPDRVDAVSYFDYNNNYNGDYVNVNATHDEFALESSLNYKFSVLNFLNFYGGAGVNMGMTFNNEMCYYTSIEPSTDELNTRNAAETNDEVMNSNYQFWNESECFSGGNDITTRGFVSIGTSITLLNRVEFGLDVKKGFGIRTNFGDSTIGTNFTSTTLRAAYILK